MRVSDWLREKLGLLPPQVPDSAEHDDEMVLDQPVDLVPEGDPEEDD